MGRLSNRTGPVGRGSLLAMHLAPRHAFYDRCNEILAEAEFDETVEMLCQPYYEDDGRLSVPPGRYFRMLFVGQFEGLDSEREIEWRCADSLSLHRFLRLVEGERVPDHPFLVEKPLYFPYAFRADSPRKNARTGGVGGGVVYLHRRPEWKVQL